MTGVAENKRRETEVWRFELFSASAPLLLFYIGLLWTLGVHNLAARQRRSVKLRANILLPLLNYALFLFCCGWPAYPNDVDSDHDVKSVSL